MVSLPTPSCFAGPELYNDLLQYSLVKTLKSIKIDESKPYEELTTTKVDEGRETQISH